MIVGHLTCIVFESHTSRKAHIESFSVAHGMKHAPAVVISIAGIDYHVEIAITGRSLHCQAQHHV